MQLSDSIFPIHFLSFKKGLAELHKLDLSSENDFLFFRTHFKGVNYQASALQKLAWIQLLKGNQAKYREYISECLKSGRDEVDEDKDAFAEATSGIQPNIFLLRSRLLFDGGYYDRAHRELTSVPLDSFPRFRDQLELTYRFGRIMEKTGQSERAINYYKQTLKNGASYRYYFAANSALLLGNLYERTEQPDSAMKYYKVCLQMDEHEYQNSIDQKAQAGVDRVKEFIEKKSQ